MAFQWRITSLNWQFEMFPMYFCLNYDTLIQSSYIRWHHAYHFCGYWAGTARRPCVQSDLGMRKTLFIKTMHQATNLKLLTAKNTEKSGLTLLDDSSYYPDQAPCGLFPVLKTQKASFWKSHRAENEVHQQFRKMAKDGLWARSHLVSRVSNLAEWSISMVSVVNFDLWLGVFSCKKVH